MPKKAPKPQAKTKPKSQERQVSVRIADGKSLEFSKHTKRYTASDARSANNNGKIKDREIVALEYPADHVPMVGFGAFVRGEFFVRQAEVPSSEEATAIIMKKQYDDLVAFLKTVNDPEEN